MEANPEQLLDAKCPTDMIYQNSGGIDPCQRPVDYFDQKVQNNTINQLLKKQSRKRIANFWIRFCVFTVFICSSDDITTCSALVRQYGASVFLPILICAICVGIPLMYLEMGLGQFTSSNPIAIFSNMAPIGAGIGYTMVIISILDVFRQAHLTTIFANILYQSLHPLFLGDFYMTRCIFPYDADCIDPHIRCAGIGSSYYSRLELQTTTRKAQFHLTYKEENSQCVSNMQVKYAVRGLTAARLSQASGIERYIDLFLTNIGHNPDAPAVPAAAMDYNIAGIIIIALLMLMMYYDTSFIEGMGVFGTIIMCMNLYFNYSSMKSSNSNTYNNFIMARGSNFNDPEMWIAVLNYVLMAIQVGQAGHMTLASSNRFSNNCFRDAIAIAIIVTIVPYTAACYLTSNWEKFIVSQMSDMEDREKYWTAEGDANSGLKNTRNTVHITSTAIFGEGQLSAIFAMMTYFLSSTTIRMMVSFRALVRTFQEQFSAQLAITWKDVCRIFACLYLCLFMIANTSSMRLLLDSIRVGMVRAMPVIVFCYLVVVMFCYGIRRTFLDLNTMLFMADKRKEQAAKAAASKKVGVKGHDTAKGGMKRCSSLINIFIGISWSLSLVIMLFLAKTAWFGGIRASDIHSVDDRDNESVVTTIFIFSCALLSPMLLIGAIRFIHYLHEAFNGTLTIQFLFSPNAAYGPKDERHRFIVANETNSVRM
ncbi:hypothetical protein PRIPAC_86644 [Pristionchus pacificus]|uniref:Neurotransmitter transporter n=1 Tax=Pristionchus pacificus TaxID=54126 RepID=A0A2A6BLB4_PRIPA|nr:hypothetical protein PRIPAC_86644 [Pristionchus pacificus]|eukprot:PDM66704.1 neurotransmitter transporter [Pristionchus pacificus]